MKPSRKTKKGQREAELAVLDVILCDNSSHSNSYVRAIAETLRPGNLGYAGYVHGVLEKFVKEGLIYRYYSPKTPRGSGWKRPYAPLALGLVRAIAEIQGTTVGKVETWLKCLSYQELDLFTAWLPRDLRHLRSVCAIAMKIVSQSRGIFHKVNPSAYIFNAVRLAALVYFLQNPALKPVQDRVVAKIGGLNKVFETRELKELSIISPETMRLLKPLESLPKPLLSQ